VGVNSEIGSKYATKSQLWYSLKKKAAHRAVASRGTFFGGYSAGNDAFWDASLHTLEHSLPYQNFIESD